MDEAQRARVALLAWVGSLVAAIALFTWLGEGRLGVPAIGDPTAWPGWLSSRSPIEAAFALGRLVVLALAWYLVGVTTLGVVARWARSLRLIRVADALAVPSVRRLLQASLGLGLATAAVISSTAQVGGGRAAPIAGGPGVVAAAADPEATDVPSPEPRTSGEPAPPTDPLWHVRPDDAAAPTAAADPADAPDSPLPAAPGTSGMPTSTPVAVAESRVDAVGEPGGTWVTQSGDHFWSIAERVLAEATGRTPSDAEVDPYWRRLVTVNRAALADSTDPDLIFPGQRFALPDLTADASAPTGAPVHAGGS